jgi:hypothetical protein
VGRVAFGRSRTLMKIFKTPNSPTADDVTALARLNAVVSRYRPAIAGSLENPVQPGPMEQRFWTPEEIPAESGA